MEALFSFINGFLQERNVNPEIAELTAQSIGLLLILLLAFFANWVAKRIILTVVHKMIRRTPWQWDDALADAGVLTRMSHIAPALVIQLLTPFVFDSAHLASKIIDSLVSVYLIVIVLSVISALLNGVSNHLNTKPIGAQVPFKGFAQAIKLVTLLIGFILILSVLLGKSPVYFFSGLGALTAILLLVFKDAIMGLVAGVMISVNQMVRIGDWIEMPKANADGDVIDVSLTTVKVRNWDKTITTIPSYDLISQSFKNWRGMFESGGRRIKRAIHIDMQTVQFADPDMLKTWQRIEILDEYLQEKLTEVERDNHTSNLDMSVLCNGRRLTNLGTFRAYCIAYLRNHKQISKELTFLVRQLAPTEHGLPLEIYVFTTDTRWAYYEGIQADIFDHLLAVIDQFGLKVFQKPSGNDLKHITASQLPVAAAATRTSALDVPADESGSA